MFHVRLFLVAALALAGALLVVNDEPAGIASGRSGLQPDDAFGVISHRVVVSELSTAQAIDTPASAQASSGLRGPLESTGSAPPKSEVSSPTTESSSLDGGGTRPLAAPPTPAPFLGFEGIDADDNQNAFKLGGTSVKTVPEPDVAVGLNHVFEMSQVTGRIYDKSGLRIETFALSDFFGTTTQIMLAPEIIYDDDSERWFATVPTLKLSPSFEGRLHLAVSDTRNPTLGWTVYDYVFGGEEVRTARMGVTNDKLSVSVSLFAPSGTLPPGCRASDRYCGERILVLEKGDFVAGVSAQLTALPRRTDRFGTRPVQSLSSVNTQWLATYDLSSTDVLTIIGVTGTPGSGNVAETTVVDLTVQAHETAPRSEAAAGSFIRSGDRFALDAVWRDDSLWVSATAECLTSFSCAHLVEVDTQTLAVTQDIMFGETGEYYSWPAITIDASGDLYVSMTHTNSGIFPEMVAAGREAGDPSGVITGTTLLRSGQVEPFIAWGKHGVAVDPGRPSATGPPGECVWMAGPYPKNVVGGPAIESMGTYIAATSYSDQCPNLESAPAGRIIKVPVRWCILEGTNLAGESISVQNTKLRDRLISVSDHVFVQPTEVSFRLGATGSMSEFPKIPSPDPAKPGEVANTADNHQVRTGCRDKWQAEAPNVTGILAVIIKDFVGSYASIAGSATVPRCGNDAAQLASLGLIFEEQFGDYVLGHELGHALCLFHGNGLNEDQDGRLDEDPPTNFDNDGDGAIDEDGNLAGDTACAGNLMCGDGALGLTGGDHTCPAPPLVARSQRHLLRCQAVFQVPGRVVDPLPEPLGNVRGDEISDVPAGEGFIDIVTVTAAVNALEGDLSFGISPTDLFPQNVSGLRYVFAADLDDDPGTGGSAAAASAAIGVTVTLDGAELLGEVLVDVAGGNVQTAAEVYKYQGGAFIPVVDEGIVSNVETLTTHGDPEPGGVQVPVVLPISQLVTLSLASSLVEPMSPPFSIEYVTRNPGTGSVDRAVHEMLLPPPVFPELTVTPSTAGPGTLVTVEASGLLPNTEAAVFVGDQQVGTAQTDADGNVVFSFEMPTVFSGTNVISVGTLPLTADGAITFEAPPGLSPVGGVVGLATNDPEASASTTGAAGLPQRYAAIVGAVALSFSALGMFTWYVRRRT